MASSYDVINLSALAVPDAIVVPDAADIFTRWLARLRALDPEFDALVESDPAYKQGEINAYRNIVLSVLVVFSFDLITRQITRGQNGVNFIQQPKNQPRRRLERCLLLVGPSRVM